MNGAFRKLLLAKIHGAVVTEANVNYEGSITIPRNLLELTGLLPHEAVHVWNVTSGTRFETYILDGGDKQSEIHKHEPKVVFLHKDNSVKDIRGEKPGTIAA